MKQISHKLIMRNINELIGIINGISYDGIINKLEVARLSSWVKKNRNLSYEHKQAHLISLVEQVLEDGIITDEEREMLLENCSQYTAFETDSIAKVYELNGIIEGIICDNEINEKEVCRLQDWMRTNESFIRYHKPSKTICEKIDQILEDGIVTQEEQKSLLEMLKKRLNDAQIETKIGYLKNCVKERKNLGIDLIDLLDNADAIDIIHSRAESQLGSTLNSYSGTYVRDPEIVFVSLVLIGMLYYDGAFYESVRKTYKSLYQRYSEQKVEGLIRTLLNNYRTKDDATGTKTRIINVVLAGSIVPSYYLGSFFEFIYDIYKLNFDSNLPDDLYGEFQFVYDGLQNVMRSESDEVQVNVTKKTYKLIKSTKQLITNPIYNDAVIKLRETVAELEKLEVVDDGQGYPSVNHPIFTVQEERTEDNYFCYPVYNSLFYRNCGVKVCNNCYHTKLTPTDQLLYIMECSKGDERLIWKSNRFFEFYIVSYDKCGNATTKKVCNTLEVSSPVCATINSLIKSIITSMSRVHIEEDVRNAIDSYMNGKATASDDNDDFALPFN